MSGLRGKKLEERLGDVDMQTLEIRRQEIDLTQVFKIIKGV
jgi:hypothetical protein